MQIADGSSWRIKSSSHFAVILQSFLLIMRVWKWWKSKLAISKLEASRRFILALTIWNSRNFHFCLPTTNQMPFDERFAEHFAANRRPSPNLKRTTVGGRVALLHDAIRGMKWPDQEREDSSWNSLRLSQTTENDFSILKRKPPSESAHLTACEILFQIRVAPAGRRALVGDSLIEIRPSSLWLRQESWKLLVETFNGNAHCLISPPNELANTWTPGLGGSSRGQ